ncbi:MAG TPA: hypothetical protein VGF29_05035 [Hyphomicrobiaceae bacterium]|jgi:hypothetical protein
MFRHHKMRVVLPTTCLALTCGELGAQQVPPWCLAINDFVKHLENGTSPGLHNVRFTLVDAKKSGAETVRQYSAVLPMAEPSEILQLEIVDNDNLRRWDTKNGVRHLRVRPHAGDVWIDVWAAAVMPDQYGPGRLPDYPTGGGFRIIFDGADGSLDVGVLFKPELQDGKAHVDRLTFAVRGQHCPHDMFDK